MNPRDQERLAEDEPKRNETDKQGSRVLASFGGALTVAALIGLAIIIVLWWILR
jgi:hypothetical protein